MLDEYGVLINLMVLGVLIFTFILGVFSYLLSKRNIKKTEQRKLLERVYNPLENAITVFDIEIEEDELNRKQQFEILKTACLDVKKNYGDLIDGETIKHFDNLDRANKDLNYLHEDEKFKNFVALTKVFHNHLCDKISEINKKPLLRFFII